MDVAGDDIISSVTKSTTTPFPSTSTSTTTSAPDHNDSASPASPDGASDEQTAAALSAAQLAANRLRAKLTNRYIIN